MVVQRCEQRLITRVAPAKGVEVDLTFAQHDLRANQSVRPRLTHREGPAEQRYGSSVSGSSEEDNHACWILVVGLPTVGNFPAAWRAFDSRRRSLADSSDILVGLRAQVLARFEMKSVPDLALPAAVVAFDRRLKACFARRSEHRNDAQRKSHAGNTAQSVRLPRSLKNRVVVELNVVRVAELAPVAQEAIHRDFRCDSRPRKRTHQSSMKRNPVENLHVFRAFKDQAFHDVEAVQFRFAFRQFRQVPALRRCRTSNTTLAVELAPSSEDAVDHFGIEANPNIFFVVGGVIGAVLAAIVMDTAIIVLSSLVGAAAIIQAVNLGQTTRSLLFLGLAALGMLIQFKLMAPPKQEHKETEQR
jgi:hypothetical protein